MTSGGTSGYSFPNSAFGANQPHGASSPVRTNRGDSKNYTRGGRIRTGISLAVGFLVVEWLVQIINFLIFGGALSNYGIRPLDFNGIWGIFTAPLLHANFEHLIGNSVPGAIFCFLIGLSGRKAWWEVTIITVLVAGIGTSMPTVSALVLTPEPTRGRARRGGFVGGRWCVGSSWRARLAILHFWQTLPRTSRTRQWRRR